MKYKKLSIPGVILFEPSVFEDNRGYFFESFSSRIFNEAVGYDVKFIQDYHSMSKKGVVRGLHYQLPPCSQGKIVRVSKGKIFDVAVDIRQNSPTFGQWVGEYLSESNKKQLWIPEGFAHGFISLEEDTELLYKVTGYYSKEYDRNILWNDKDINIEWPLHLIEGEIIVSDKDKAASLFLNSDKF